MFSMRAMSDELSNNMLMVGGRSSNQLSKLGLNESKPQENRFSAMSKPIYEYPLRSSNIKDT